MEGGTRPASEHLMLISPERVFYAGLLGKPRQRTSGGLNVYVALHGELSVSLGSTVACGELVVVPPYTVHGVESDYPSTICMVIDRSICARMRSAHTCASTPVSTAVTGRQVVVTRTPEASTFNIPPIGNFRIPRKIDKGAGT